MNLETRISGFVAAVGADVKALFASKQDTLASGTNIKTLHSQSLLGAGNLSLVTELFTTVGTTLWTAPVDGRYKFTCYGPGAGGGGGSASGTPGGGGGSGGKSELTVQLPTGYQLNITIPAGGAGGAAGASGSALIAPTKITLNSMRFPPFLFANVGLPGAAGSDTLAIVPGGAAAPADTRAFTNAVYSPGIPGQPGFVGATHSQSALVAGITNSAGVLTAVNAGGAGGAVGSAGGDGSQGCVIIEYWM